MVCMSVWLHSLTILFPPHHPPQLVLSFSRIPWHMQAAHTNTICDARSKGSDSDRGPRFGERERKRGASFGERGCFERESGEGRNRSSASSAFRLMHSFFTMAASDCKRRCNVAVGA